MNQLTNGGIREGIGEGKVADGSFGLKRNWSEEKLREAMGLMGTLMKRD